jgi:hypothetical protein
LKYYPGIFLELQRRIAEVIFHVSESGLRYYLRPSEYEAGVNHLTMPFIDVF